MNKLNVRVNVKALFEFCKWRLCWKTIIYVLLEIYFQILICLRVAVILGGCNVAGRVNRWEKCKRANLELVREKLVKYEEVWRSKRILYHAIFLNREELLHPAFCVKEFRCNEFSYIWEIFNNFSSRYWNTNCLKSEASVYWRSHSENEEKMWLQLFESKREYPEFNQETEIFLQENFPDPSFLLRKYSDTPTRIQSAVYRKYLRHYPTEA